MRNKTLLSKQMITSWFNRKRFSTLSGMSFMLILIALFTWQCKDDDYTGELIGVCPEVISTDPAKGAINVVTSKLITATFNEEMDAATINETTFFVKNGTSIISGEVIYSNKKATFIPSTLLDANTVYTATITRGATDPMGNVMIADYTWSFNTGAIPRVILTAPLYGASDVGSNDIISADFSTAMNATSINASTFVLMQGTTLIPGVITYSGIKAIFTPNAPLAANKVYAATVSKNVKDVAGNSMAKDTTWSFATGVLPIITITDPVDGAINIALDKKITATFSKAMNILTINSLTFTLKQGTTVVSGLVTYKDMTATFTPTSSLLYGTEYTATITSGVKDLSNKSIPKDSTWTFTTGMLVVPVLPYVTATDPAQGATNVAVDKVIKATFSKDMNAATVSSSTFKLMNGSTPVLGFVTYVGRDAFFTPAAPLTRGVTYEAIITTGAKDLDGNAMASEKKWSFSTIAALAQYTVSLSNLPLIGGTTTGEGVYNAGASVTAVAVTNPGFFFANWTENGIIVSTTPTFTFVVNSNRTLVANYTTPRLLVCLSSNPVMGGTTSGGGLFDPGNAVTVVAKANAGYTFTNWTENGLIVSALASYSFNINTSRTLVANFVLTQYNVVLSSNPVLGGLTSGGGTFSSGTSITVTATANTGYTFTNWTENGVIVSTLANYNFNVNSNRTFVAHFALAQYSIALSANPSLGGLTSGGGTFTSGTSVTALATANANYTFVNWTENGVIASLLPSYTFSVTKNRVLVANFVSTQLNINLSSNPVLGGSTSGGGTVNSGSSVTVMASANAGYSFTNWTENGLVVSALVNYTFVANTSRNLVANFVTNQYTLNLSSAPANGGTTTGGGTYSAGSSVTARAVPMNGGFSFTNWTENGLVVSTLANYTFNINGNRTLVAHFATVNAGPAGIDLGSAANFAILAGAGVSNTGVSTLIKGDVGSFPTATINGLLAGNVVGTLYTSANPLVGTAKNDLTAAYNDAQGRSLNAISLPGQLGGLTLAPGLYVNSSTTGISGTGANGILTLDAGGNPNAVWIFKMGSTLVTDAGTSIVLAGGAQAKNIYWSVGTSATLGTNSIFYGNILADQSITLTTGATLNGRALTRIASVTLDSNAVTKP